MNHVQRRFVSTAAKLTSVSPSAATAFPPRDALKRKKDAFVTDEFDPDSWAHVQPAPSSALVAFAHRVGLASIFDSPDTIRQACTHPSFLALYRKHFPITKASPEPKTNAQLATIGNSLMGLFATEYIHAKYPYLPTRVLKAAISAHVGPGTCDSVAREMGATPLLRWHRSPETENAAPVLHSDAMASIPRSLTALIYQERSLLAAREFVHTHFLSRQVDIRAMLKFFNPKKSLLEMVQKYGRELPKSRLLKETGRFSNSPVFVVGIFSGADQLGEGFGASLRMAEYRAAEDALMRVYLTQTPSELIQLPTSTFPSVNGNVYTSGTEGTYLAPDIAPSDILYASSGRSRVPVSTRS